MSQDNMRCSFPECRRAVAARGLCKPHRAQERNGEPLAPILHRGAPIEEREASFWAKVNKDGPTQPHMETPCWVWTGGLQGGGYGSAHWCGLNGSHRISYLFAFGPLPAGAWVLHACDTPACVRPDHLFVGDLALNIADMVAKGRHTHGERHYARNEPHRLARGEHHGEAKLTTSDVVEMRRLAAIGCSHSEIAAAFKIGKSQASNVIHRRHWTHVP